MLLEIPEITLVGVVISGQGINNAILILELHFTYQEVP